MNTTNHKLQDGLAHRFVAVVAAWLLICQSPATAKTQAADRADSSSARAARRTPVVEVFEASRDAVVNISAKEIITVRDPFGGIGSIFEDFFDMGRPPGMGGGQRQITRTSVGSGFVIHPDGYIVTNAHVVAQTAERKAIFADGREYDAQVVAFDTQRDLAVLKIDADRPLHAIRLGRSNDLMIGETVIAIGNPVGLQNTVTAGVISATGRDLQFNNQLSLKGLIQTDASINPGNSGGPLLNVLGELIGVNSAIRGDAQNIGFAIPVDQLREVLPDLLDVERRYRLECGLTVDTLNSPKVLTVRPDSPAAAAGLRVGDVIRRFDDRPIHEGIDFCIALIGCRAGQTVNLEFDRAGKPMQARVKLETRPLPDGSKLASEKLGMEVDDLTPDGAEALGLPRVRGLVVTRLEAGGPAEQAGIQRRDVLVAIGRHAVASTDDLGQLLEFVRSGQSVPVTVLRVDRRMKMKLSGELRAR
jgi:serine protease Do